MWTRIIALFLCVLAPFFHVFAEQPRQSLLEQRRECLAGALKDAELVGGDEFFDKAFKEFGVAKPGELDKTIVVAFPKDGHLLPAALKIKKVNTEPSLWSDAVIEVEDDRGHSFSVSVLLNPESLLSIKFMIMRGAFRRAAPYYPGEPKVGHYANSSYLDVTFCVNNSIVKISGAPVGEETPDWPKIFEPIAKEVAGVLLSSPIAETKESPEKFGASVTPAEGGYLIRFNYDKSIENCWVKCETSSGTVERLDFDQVKLSVQGGQAATVTLLAVSPDGKTAYKAALKIPDDVQQSENGQPPLPPQNSGNGASILPPDGTHPTGADNTAQDATGTGTSSEGGAEGAVAEAAPFPWAIVIVAVAAALALGAITTLLLARRKKA